MLRAILGGFVVLTAIFITIILNEGDSHVLPLEKNASPTIKVTQAQKDKFHLKKTHAGLSLECVYCHMDQGDDPEKFELPDEEVCLNCHQSKEYLAQRLEFMDTLKANPHNSIHDGPNLYCDECHREHQPSINMCAECHEKEINNNVWMKETP